MGMLDIFRRKEQIETRSVATGYTTDLMAARQEWFKGGDDLAELTATVQSCVSLWESGFTLADVDGTDLLDRRRLALIGRSLALRGEAVFLIRDTLIPCTDWDMTTRDGEPTAYRVHVSEMNGGNAITALAGEVLHVRIGSSMLTPWAGTSPLRRSSLSGDMLTAVETSLRDVYRDAPIGSVIIPLPDSSTEDMALMRRQLVGRRGAAIVVEGVAQATAAGMNPQLEKRVEQIGPDIQRAMPPEILRAARDAVLMSYGVLPALTNPAAAGPAVRESQRHLAQIILQPIALLVAEEATAKLGQSVKMDVVRPMQAFDQGGKARAFATMIGALAEAKAAGVDMATVKDAEAFIDWAD